METAYRFLCFVGADDGLQDVWSRRSYEYLSAIRDAGLLVRAISVGAARLESRRGSGPAWSNVADAFTYQALAGSLRVNVVCAPLGMYLGAPKKTTSIDAETGGRVEQTGYDPSTAIRGLWTEGMINVAITGGETQSRSEIECLRSHYDLVLCAEADDVEYLARQGIPDAELVTYLGIAERLRTCATRHLSTPTAEEQMDDSMDKVLSGILDASSLEDPKHGKIAELQIELRGMSISTGGVDGNTMAGIVRRGPHPGVYVLGTATKAGRDAPGMTAGEVCVIEQFFLARDVRRIVRAAPTSGIVLPGDLV